MGKYKPGYYAVLEASIGIFWLNSNLNNLTERLLGKQTNNQAKIYAMIRTLEYISYRNMLVKNSDLIKSLKYLIDNRIGTVSFIHVRGYIGNYENEQADKLSKEESLKEIKLLEENS
ncbi:25974_t:CDS:2, partial [Gigaspora margarita]